MNSLIPSRVIRHSRLALRPRAAHISDAYKQCRRRFSTAEPPPPPLHPNSTSAPPRTNVWLATVGLGTLGAGALAYAAYDAYDNWRNLYPLEVRVDLKRGIGAKRKGDRESSAYYKRKAWDTARGLPIEEFRTEPYLRLTGIAVDLAGELEEDGKNQEAFTLYSEALDLIRDSVPEQVLSERERFRGVSIAVKLGQLAGPVELPAEQEEKIFVWAVEEMLKLLMDIQGTPSSGDAVQPLDFVKLKLPNWLTKTDVTVPLQELGDFYGRVGKLEYAIPLYLQTISLLISDGGSQAPPEDMCRGAQLMNNVAELIARGEATAERQKSAESWAQQALSIIQAARKDTKEPISTCEHALCVALFNAGMLREMAGDDKRARSFFTAAFEQSQSYGTEEGVAAAKEAIERLNAKGT
ncbi:hypothetical protein DFH06DRAFT_1186042 [Mycena polygramma]|nr:hypothetical protein DFH06DRAFT_1186042 [Mycena polygramma]